MRALGAFVLGLILAAHAAAQQQLPNVLVQGVLTASGPDGRDEQTVIECRGIPTCVGEYKSHVRQAGCDNYLTQRGPFTFTGLTLGQSGPVSGTLTATSPDVDRGPNRFCTHRGTFETETGSYTGTWNLATQRGSLRLAYGPDDTQDITFTADLVAPVELFGMTVRALVDAKATASADLRFRDQDVGRNGSVFAFASAPAPNVLNGLDAKAVKLGMSTKADTPCVLSQVNPQGQLVAVTAAQMQALVTGAFSAAGTSVQILNNIPADDLAGATVYVGYGTSAGQMLNEGVFRNAVLVRGSVTCPPLPYVTSLWWNPTESGWGLNVSQQGSLAFATLFTYDSARAPLWLVMSAGAMQNDGVTFTGPLYRTTGPAFNANPFTPIGPGNVTEVGTMTISLIDANSATLSYTNNGVQVQKNIQRQVFGTRSAVCLPTTAPSASSTQYQDLWWNAAESGWGINLTHQDNTIFGTLFTYDAAGRGLWLVMPAGVRQADGSYFGDLYHTTGSAFNTQPFPPIGGADVVDVGDMRLRFTNGNNGTLTYNFNGTSVTKSVTRQVFSSPQSACN
jgi:hypothetical protein